MKAVEDALISDIADLNTAMNAYVKTDTSTDVEDKETETRQIMTSKLCQTVEDIKAPEHIFFFFSV